jgi:hypothetical protein
MCDVETMKARQYCMRCIEIIGTGRICRVHIKFGGQILWYM